MLVLSSQGIHYINFQNVKLLCYHVEEVTIGMYTMNFELSLLPFYNTLHSRNAYSNFRDSEFKTLQQ